jgi:hypothetical protein
MKKLLFLLSATLIFIAGCKKDDDEPEDTTSVTIKNVSGNYKLTDYALKSGSVTISFYDSIPSCSQDDIITLKTDKTYTWADSGVKCTGSTDETGTWDLSGTTKFIWDGDTLDINRFDGKDLEISFTEEDDQTGQDVSLIFKFRKQ